MNILITSAGQRVSLIRAFRRELQQFYSDSKVFTTDMNPRLSAACNVSDHFFTIRRVTDPEYIYQLLEVCKSANVKMVIPTIDTELLILAKNKSIFDNEGIHLIISNELFVSICRDKRRMHQYFLDRLINVPKIIDKENPTFPLFIKPYDGSLSADTFLIENSSQLTRYHYENERLIFMEYINKEFNEEFTIDMYFGKDNKVKCIVPRKRVWVRAGEVNKALTCKNEILNFLREKLGEIEGAIGCLTLQVFMNKKNKQITGIEINPRFGGGYPLSYMAGANFPKWLIQEYFFNENINYTEDWEDDLLMLRYDDEVLVHGYKS